MNLSDTLKIRPGVTAVIGSGGKTTLLRVLADELPGTVILTTSTHILPFDGIPLLTSPTREELRAALAMHRVVCIGTPAAEGKLTAPALPFSVLQTLADYVLVEADGSKRLPLKAHAPLEPVIPENARQTICVVGASGFGKPICDAVHRPERFCARTGTRMSDAVTPALAAQGILAERLADTVLLNQIDCISPEDARTFADLLQKNGVKAVCASLNGKFPRKNYALLIPHS